MKDATTQHELRNDSGKTRTKGGNVGIAKTPKSADKGKKLNAKEEGDLIEIKNAISPVTPGQSETKKKMLNLSFVNRDLLQAMRNHIHIKQRTNRLYITLTQ